MENISDRLENLLLERQLDEMLIYKITELINKFYSLDMYYQEKISFQKLLEDLNSFIDKSYTIDEDELSKELNNIYEAFLISNSKLKKLMYQKERNLRLELFEKEVTDNFNKKEIEKERDKEILKQKKEDDLNREKLKHTNQIEFIKSYSKSNNDNLFIKNLYEQINDDHEKIEYIYKSQRELNTTENIDNLDTELNAHKENMEINKKIALNYIEKSTKISNAISFLNKPSKHLLKERKYMIKQRKLFNEYSIYCFKISSILFGLYILFLILSFMFEYSFFIEHKLELTVYLFFTFPIIFITLLGLLLVRQSNLKTNEIKEINRRFILIHEVNQSLRALVEVYIDKEMDDKTEKIIDKLIVNILNYASDKHDNKDNKDELYESNVKFDELIDSINKKLTFVTDTVKNLKGSN